MEHEGSLLFRAMTSHFSHRTLSPPLRPSLDLLAHRTSSE